MKRVRLAKPYLPELQEIADKLNVALKDGRLSNFGRYSLELEKEVSEKINVTHSLCVTNATTGLILLLSTLPKNTEVILPSFTFLASAQAVLWNSLTPVFADIDPNTYAISTDSVESKVSDRTSAVLAVNIFGSPCEISRLEALREAIVRKRKRSSSQLPFRLFFDSAHSLGSRYRGRHVGGFGDAEVFSLSDTKIVGCGEGGIITTRDDKIAKDLLDRRNYGFRHGEKNSFNMGLNGKMPEFSAILGLWGLQTLEWQIEKRQQLVEIYKRLLGSLHEIKFQVVHPEDMSTYKDFVIEIQDESLQINRDGVMKELARRMISTEAYFSPPLHCMSLFKASGLGSARLPETERVSRRILSLPMYTEITDEDIALVAKSVRDIIESSRCG